MLKKTIVKLIAVLIIVAVPLMSFIGCTFIKENKDRVANQELITVKNPDNGITLTITRNEITDYFNNYAYMLVNYYGYSVEQAMDFTIESKIKNKYLITCAMDYLTKEVAARKTVLKGNGAKVNPVDVLTLAEYAVAVYSVNESVMSMLKTYADENYQRKLTSAVSNIDKMDIDRIEFAPSTLAYLKDEYYLNQAIDTDMVKFVVYYDDETKNVNQTEYIVPTSMYTTAFDSSTAGTDLKLEISLDEKIYEEDGTVTYETLSLTHTYAVIEPRATKTEPTPAADPDTLEIGDITVNRYATLAELQEAGADYGFRGNVSLSEISTDTVAHGIIYDIGALYTAAKADVNFDADVLDGLRQLSESLASSYKTMDYIYAAGYESAVTSALQSEVQKGASRTEEEWDAAVLAEYQQLYANSKRTYDETAADDVQSAFATAIKSGLDAYYYHPQIEDLSDYIYVYQILFNFSEDQKALLTEAGSNEDLKQEYMKFLTNSITTKQSNPKYDSAYACEKHALGKTDASCKWEEEKDPDDEHLCPSIAYVTDADGKIKEYAFWDVYDALSLALQGVMGGTDPAGLNTAEKQKEAFDIFEDYMYRYNDDAGIMNSASGYLITPEGTDDPNGFYESFVDLAREVFAANGSVGNAFVEDGNGGYKLGYAFTDYGVHIIMTASRPFETTGASALPLVTNAEDLKNMKINLAGDTVYSVIKAKLESDSKTQYYNTFTNNIIDADLHDDAEKVTKNEKQIKKIYETYVG